MIDKPTEPDIDLTFTDTERSCLRWRGVDPRDACRTCRGRGSHAYASTATWRGGLGGSAITRDVCDVCWGSGETTAWVALRAMRERHDHDVRVEAAGLLGTQMGASFSSLRPAIMALCEVLDREQRRRKNPVGSDFQSNRSWELVTGQLARLLRRLVAVEDT